jgi:hypothetical protein
MCLLENTQLAFHLTQIFITVFYLDIQDDNFACGSVWVRNLVSDIKGGTQTEGVWEQGAEEDIWTEEGWDDGRMEKTA